MGLRIQGQLVMFYVIRNVDDDQLFWSNEQGWVSSPGETVFTDEERFFLDLPIGGVWVRDSNLNLIVTFLGRRHSEHGIFYENRIPLRAPNTNPDLLIQLLNELGWRVNAILKVKTLNP